MFQSQNDRVHVTSRRRLLNKDYSEPGLYFVTICIKDWSHRLGRVSDGDFSPSPAGTMVDALWCQARNRFPGLHLDAYCVMPNHFHGIVGIGMHEDDPPPFPSVISVMDWFKSATTVEYIRGVKQHGWPPYQKHLWLEGYHDRVIRGDEELQRIRDYIASNPANWRKDGFFGE